MTDWAAFYKQVERCKPDMLAWMRELATSFTTRTRTQCCLRKDDSEVIERNDDDFAVAFQVSRPDGKKLDVLFEIWDSGDTDDGIYGKHGNFVFHLVEEGGRVIHQYIPNNYSDQVWVDYTDNAEWDLRRQHIIATTDETRELIRRWSRNEILVEHRDYNFF